MVRPPRGSTTAHFDAAHNHCQPRIDVALEPHATRLWEPSWTMSLDRIMSMHAMGRDDPSQIRLMPGHWVKAMNTPLGPAVLEILARPQQGVVHFQGWGPGHTWALSQAPAMVGADDETAGFVPLPEHPALVEAHRRFSGWRVPKSGLVLDTLAFTALSQVVTGAEAHYSWRTLVRAFGTQIYHSGHHPWHGRTLWVPPNAKQWLGIRPDQWLTAMVTKSRRDVIIAAARVADGLFRTTTWDDPARVDSVLRSIPGVGVWTSAEVRQRVHGHADAFSFYDYHVAKDVSWALSGRILDDAQCAALLEPYRGHRFRVQHLLAMAGLRRPRRGARFSIPTHLPTPRSAPGQRVMRRR